jgi:hypothetical protein
MLPQRSAPTHAGDPALSLFVSGAASPDVVVLCAPRPDLRGLAAAPSDRDGVLDVDMLDVSHRLGTHLPEGMR